jgi:GMP synthase-like glutamine amidotransferase
MTSQTIEGASAPVRLLVVQNDPTDPPALLGDWWEEDGVELVVVRADQGETVPTALPDDVDGLVVLGGEMAAWEDHVAPWLPDERTLVASTVESGVPVLGVCLGGQVMTLACGGVVERAEVAEIGLVEITLLPGADADPLLSVLPQGVPVGQYHIDTMAVLPEGAVLLASSADCAHQAYRLGERAWALQFHPEIDAEIMASWIDDDPGAVADRGFERDAIVTEFRAREPEVLEAWRPFARAFADVVRASAAR